MGKEREWKPWASPRRLSGCQHVSKKTHKCRETVAPTLLYKRALATRTKAGEEKRICGAADGRKKKMDKLTRLLACINWMLLSAPSLSQKAEEPKLRAPGHQSNNPSFFHLLLLLPSALPPPPSASPDPTPPPLLTHLQTLSRASHENTWGKGIEEGGGREGGRGWGRGWRQTVFPGGRSDSQQRVWKEVTHV